MKLIDMGIRNYRQFEKAEISFDEIGRAHV